MGAEAVSAIMAATRAMVAITKAITVFNVVPCLTIPVAHLAIVIAPCVDGSIAYSDLSSTTSLALEIGGLVHVAVNAATDASYGVSSGKVVRTPIHS